MNLVNSDWSCSINPDKRISGTFYMGLLNSMAICESQTLVQEQG